MVWHKPVDGVRAVTHLSLIGLHAAMITTAHLPSQGPLWQAIAKHPLYTFLQAGGTQVDVCLMLSGFLLMTRLLRAPPVPSPGATLSFAAQRALRMLPAMMVTTAIYGAMGDPWDPPYGLDGLPRWQRIALAWTFVSNYCDVDQVGSYALTLCWSVNVDVHCGIVLFVLVAMLNRGVPDAATRARRARPLMLLLVVAAVGVRAALFTVDELNIFLLGQHSHFGLLQSDSSYGWTSDHYHHAWQTSNTAKTLSHAYVNRMYSPTHTRFGPVAVGALLACNVLLAEEETPKPSMLGMLVAALCTMQALATLVVPCLPSSDDVPLEGQLIATAALRTLSASSAAFLLYRALVPATHAWSSSWLRRIFSAPWLTVVSTVSYCSYLIHFRVLLELSLRFLTPAPLTEAQLAAPDFPSNTVGVYLTHMLTIAATATALSLGAAWVLHLAVEKPANQMVKRMFARKSDAKRA